MNSTPLLFFARNKFFKKLFIVISLAVMPPVLIIMLFINEIYFDTLNQYIKLESHNTALKAASGINQIILDTIDIAKLATTNTKINAYILNPSSQNKSNAQSELTKLLAGNKNKLELHIISRESKSTISTAFTPNIYFYHNWGVFSKLSETEDDFLVYPVNYKGIKGDSICLTVAAKVKNSAGQVVGWVMADLYRAYLFSGIYPLNTALNADYTIRYNKDFVVLTTANNLLEGVKADIEDNGKNKEPSFTQLETEIGYGLKGILTSNSQLLAKQRESTMGAFYLLCGLSLLICFGLAFLVSANITKPIMQIKEAIEEVGTGDLSVSLCLNRDDELGILETEFNKLVTRLKDLIEARIEEAGLLKTAQLEALQSQINPHFLFNTLGVIKSLNEIGRKEQISDVVIKLSKILRNSIDFSDRLITLEEELTLVACYIDIQNVRFNNKFNLIIDVPKNLLSITLRPLLIQPLVENSIIHGLEKKSSKGTLYIKAQEEGSGIIFTISDDGLGISPQMVDIINNGVAISKKDKPSIGIINVKRRISLYYGNSCYLRVNSKEGLGTIVTMRIEKIRYNL